VIPDSFYVLDGLFHTFMTILNEFGIFEENIINELNEQLPLLATTKILMECVKVGMGREEAHEIIKKHSTSVAPRNLLSALAGEKGFPFSVSQLTGMSNNPADFAGISIEQGRKVANLIMLVVKEKISKVELTDLR
jgi:adenylosuccinate lyase